MLSYKLCRVSTDVQKCLAYVDAGILLLLPPANAAANYVVAFIYCSFVLGC